MHIRDTLVKSQMRFDPLLYKQNTNATKKYKKMEKMF